MIDVQNVRKEFDGFAALGGATLTVPNGAVYGLVGPNGAGKSTLIRHITGIYRQDVGEITVDGEAVFENPSAKARIASIPDDWYYFLQSDVRDMMRFYRGFYPKFNMERYEKFKEEFTGAALSVFGSGYAWLVIDPQGKLKIVTTANQDTPLAGNLAPVLVIDVWEHAYYLKHFNVRADYIKDWFEVVNWRFSEEQYKKNSPQVRGH